MISNLSEMALPLEENGKMQLSRAKKTLQREGSHLIAISK